LHFIIPRNYILEKKIFGFLDYSSGIFLLFFSIIVFAILSFFHISFIVKLSIFLVLFFPIFLLSISGFYRESLLDIIFYIFKYAISQKLYLYM